MFSHLRGELMNRSVINTTTKLECIFDWFNFASKLTLSSKAMCLLCSIQNPLHSNIYKIMTLTEFKVISWTVQTTAWRKYFNKVRVC